MKEIEVQAIVLDRLVSELKRGEKRHVNLLQELTGEVSFKDLRAAIYYLSELGFILHDDNIPDNEGFYCKITREGVRHHMDIFDAQKEGEKELSWTEKFQNIIHFFENAKTLATAIVVVITLIFGLNIQKIAHKFPVLASILHIEVQEDLNKKVSLPLNRLKSIQKEKGLIRKEERR
jgi:hypothetical protein